MASKEEPRKKGEGKPQKEMVFSPAGLKNSGIAEVKSL